MSDPRCALCLHTRGAHDAVPDGRGYRPCGVREWVGFGDTPAPCGCVGFVEEGL